MKTLIKKICDDVIKKYKQDKNVLGIMLFGSAARNKFDEYSDIDIYVLLKKKGEYSRYNFIKNKYRIDIILDTLKEAKLYLKEDKFNVKRPTSHMLAYGKILYQTKNNLKIIQNNAKNNLKLKTKYDKNEILMHKYSIDDFWGEVQRDIKNKDYLAFGLDSQLLLNNIIELFLKLRGVFFRQPNEMKKFLEKLDKNFTHDVEKFHKANNLQIKKEILSKLVKYIYKLSKGPLPEKWGIRN